MQRMLAPWAIVARTIPTTRTTIAASPLPFGMTLPRTASTHNTKHTACFALVSATSWFRCCTAAMCRLQLKMLNGARLFAVFCSDRSERLH